MPRPSLPRRATRAQLVLLLTVASELEHGLACLYLFAAYSIPDEENADHPRAARLREWKRAVAQIGVEEMLHLAQVANLLTAVGGAPHLGRPNFPQPPNIYPFDLGLTLEPFGRTTLERLLRFELPEADADGEPCFVDGPQDGIEPSVPAFATIGALYRAIEELIVALPERDVFIGPREAQTQGKTLSFGRDLVQVTSRATALQAIERIVEQGEGTTRKAESGHFATFSRLLGELDEELARDPSFEPGLQGAPNPVTRHRWDAGAAGTLICDPLTHRVAEFANFAYETLLLVLVRLFAHAGDSDAELQTLGDLAITLMARVMRPLGETLARMPIGGDSPLYAGLEFGVTRDIHLLPHRSTAYAVLEERLRRLEAHLIFLAEEVPRLASLREPLGSMVERWSIVAAHSHDRSPPA